MTETHMNAIRLYALGDPGELRYERVSTPQPAAGDALVQVHATAITRDELDWPEGRLPATPSYEFSGVVVALGPGVQAPSVGDAVYALSGFDRDGAAAEYLVIPAAFLAPKPRTLTHVESATLPLAGLSAWQGLLDHGRLEPGQRVLIHGATGGVGSLAIQLASAHGAHVIATTSSGSLETARRLGAHEVIDHTTTRFEEAIGPVELVFDTVGGDRLNRSPAVLRPAGRLVSIAAQPPSAATTPGITSQYFIVEPNREQLRELARLADQGQLRPSIDSVFPLAEAQAAFERSSGHEHQGKIVLSVLD